MCGIAGMFTGALAIANRGNGGGSSDVAAGFEATQRRAVEAMTAALEHRGPDGAGVHSGPGFALGHRRLSIVDIAGSSQPMGLEDDSLWLTFNGEIYNYLELRAELEASGVVFRTGGDTEVLLHGYRAWGRELPERLRGMFAFVIVDRRKGTLFAARDRLGKKPLFWSMAQGTFAFASEVKGLLAGMGETPALAPHAIAQFFALRYVPDPDTAFEGLHTLPPGHRLELDATADRPVIDAYWHLSFNPVEKPLAALESEVLELLDESVRVRLMGEVPLAPFLSGGIDSYAVVESMTRSLDRPVQACTIGFEDPRFDERPFARQSAEAVGATLLEEVLTPEEMLDLGWFSEVFDQPFSDSSAIPTYHVSRLARRHVTVALSGDGGDEGFAGYRRYLFDVKENKMRRVLPQAMWSFFGAVYPKADFLPRYMRFKRTFQNLGCGADEAYARSVSASTPEEVAKILSPAFRSSMGDPLEPVRKAWREADAEDPLSRAIAADIKTWLAGDILTKVDRTSMAVSLEVRAPFLDHHMVEFAARLPVRHKLAGGQTKAFLRKALGGRLGADALVRPKRGFSVPLRDWFRGPLGGALETELQGDSADRLATVLDLDHLRGALASHRAGRRDASELLWACLAFAKFQRRWAS